jgi:nucleoside-diphosphate-sugar epimerase
MKVLITGAAGRLGSEVTRHIQSAGIDFRATDRRGGRDLLFDVEVADIRVREACYPLVEGCDAVVHLANHPNAIVADAQTVFNENCAMNMNVFQAAMEAGAKRIIFASSIQAISGARKFDDSVDEQEPSSLPYLPLDGNAPANPGNPYAASKVGGEMLLQYFRKFHGLCGVAVRFPMLVPRDSISIRLRSLDQLGRGANLDEAFTFLSFADAARLIVALLRTPIDGYHAYFPAAREPWLQMPIPQIVSRFYPNVPLRRPIDELNSLIDLSQIERDTGWLPEDELPRAEPE